MIEILFWLSLLFIFYTYAGYPIVLFIWSRLFPMSVDKKYMVPFPMVSVVIAARNEEKYIADKIKNLSQQDYPVDKFEIIIISDGSTDRTLEILADLRKRFEETPKQPVLRLIKVKENKGKPNALNLGVHAATGDFIVFTDARQKFTPTAIKELLANFSDEKVGSVSGELVFVKDMNSPVETEMCFYWNLEKKVRRMESTIHSVPGATGAIYAIRKELYTPVPKETLLDDVYIPMNIVLKGYRSIFEANALAFDSYSKSFSQEKRRKVRTLAGNYQLLTLMPRLLNPLQNRIFFRYLSHKVFRLLIPFIFIVFLVTLLILNEPVYRYFFIGTLIFIFSAAFSRYTKKIPLIGFLGKVSVTFFTLNYFAFLALFYWIKRGQKQEW